MGSVNNLEISTNDNVIITINGNLGNLILPNTTHTVTIKSTSYTGNEFVEMPNAINDGSCIGKYHFNIIDII